MWVAPGMWPGSIRRPRARRSTPATPGLTEGVGFPAGVTSGFSLAGLAQEVGIRLRHGGWLSGWVDGPPRDAPGRGGMGRQDGDAGECAGRCREGQPAITPAGDTCSGPSDGRGPS